MCSLETALILSREESFLVFLAVGKAALGAMTPWIVFRRDTWYYWLNTIPKY
jgi:hypothetical protein